MSVIGKYTFEGWCEKKFTTELCAVDGMVMYFMVHGAARQDSVTHAKQRQCWGQRLLHCKKRLSFQIFHQIIEILLHVSQRISIVIVWHRQMTNVAIYHWWCIFVCGDWVLIWCWKMDSSSDFENFTYLWSLDISQSYGLTAFAKHNKIGLKMHCIRLTRKWHVGLKPI